VPFAISARTGQYLEDVGAENIEDVSRNVAGLSVQNLGPGQSQVSLRGVSAGKTDRDLPGVKEQVGVYLDESVISLSLFTPDLDLYDLNRVEVLRGPQGTLFGSGSIGGTVRYITNQPDLSDGYGDFEVGLNTISEGSDGGFVRGMFNMPLGDRAALRVVGYFNEIPGYIDAHGPGGTLDENVNDGERQGGRLALRWELTDNVVITPRVIYQDIDVNGYNREDIYNILANPFTTTEPAVVMGEREQYRQLDEHFDDDIFLGDLTMEFDLGPAMLTSVSSYTDRDILVTRDASQLTGSITFDVFATATSADIRLDSRLLDYTTVETFTQELRLASDYDGRFQWVIGGFYSDIERFYGQSLPTPGYDAVVGAPSSQFGSPTDTPFFSQIPYDFKQTAFFAEGSWDITERFNATVGARYYDFSEDRDLYFAGAFVDTDGGPDEPTNIPASSDDDGVLPRVLLAYDVSENVQLNAQASEGHRRPADAGGGGHLLVAHHIQRAGRALAGRRARTDGGSDGAVRFRDFGDIHGVRDRHQRHLDQRRRHHDRGCHRGRQPPPVGAGIPALGERDVHLADVGARRRLHHGRLSARGQPLHADRRPGRRLRYVHDPPLRRPERHELHVRSAAAGLRHRQRAARRARRRLGGRAVREQRRRRERAPRPRPGARPLRARRLPGEPAAHLRHLLQQGIRPLGARAGRRRGAAAPATPAAASAAAPG
jgi:hypothetical protein